MIIIKFISLLSLIFILGVSLVGLFGELKLAEKIGNSFLLGLLFTTFIFFANYFLTHSFSITYLFLLLIPSILILNLFVYKQTIEFFKQIFQLDFKQGVFKYRFLLFLVLFYLVVTLIFNYLWPISDWDSIALYDFRARVLTTGNWDIGIKLGYFFHYPPFTSLMHGLGYLLEFEQVKVFYSLMFGSFLFSFYGLLRRRLSVVRSIVGTFLLTITPLLSGHVLVAYTNLPYSIFFSLGIIYTWEWLSKRSNSDFVYALLFLSGSLWIRQSEPFWLIPLGMIILTQIFSKKKLPLITFLSGLAIFVGVYNFWPSYVKTLHLVNKLTLEDSNAIPLDLSLKNIFTNLFLVINHLFVYFIKPLISYLVPFSFILFFDKEFRKNRHLVIALFTLIVFSLMVFAGTYIFSFTFRTWREIGGSLSRMIMFFEPLLIYLIMFSSLWFLDDKVDRVD